MWLITNLGFFSVVRKPGDVDLTVRARVREDLERLRAQVPELGEVREGGGTDYPFRATVSPEALGRGFGQLVTGIDYANFKSEVARRMGMARERVYAEIWGVLHRLEEKGSRR